MSALVGRALRAPGQPLDAATRARLEPRFGRPFDQVRVHRDADAARSAEAVGARAYTVGRHVVFRAGEYAPHTAAGFRLLTHELAHTVQQGPGSTDPAGLDLAVTRPEGRAEREARSVERAFARGGSLPGIPRHPVRIARQENEGSGATAPPAPAGPAAIRTVKVWLNAFIPKDIEGLTKPVPNRDGETMIEGPTFLSDCFLTDQRSFSPDIDAKSRMHSEIEIDVETGRPTLEFHDCDPTEEVDCEDGETECKESCDTSRMAFSGLRTTPGGMIQVDLEGAANNPCFTGSPDINYLGTVTVDPVARMVGFKGKIDAFPAFEMYATANAGAGVALFEELPPEGNGPGDLFGGANRKVEASAEMG